LGRLAVISTPIGNLGDLSPRARDELAAAELVAAEDTRRTLWMSYGANANAGLKRTKGSPILIVESAKLGVFPEKLGNYPADNLPRALRFRHGGNVNMRGMAGADYDRVGLGSLYPNAGALGSLVDGNYQPRQFANAGFLDGHVEAMQHFKLFTINPGAPDNYAAPFSQPWFGTRRTGEVSF
jgi:prepilin-type processing-associated H-X9-DG protein